ncbi:MAG TPA: hypothetical protein VK636_20660 [Gemmatimonadaceae bacterium]|nr:hypothetical protein [Gemmatimonadaceae bacterium]
MPTLSRRTFLAALASAVPLALVVRRAHAAAVVHLQSNPATLGALAECVLPSALGKIGAAKEAASLRDWGAGYHEGAEINHGYGTSRLRTTGPTPVTRWATQLDELDAAARAKHQRAFREVSVADRQAIVRSALAGQRLDRIPAVADANHVAVALLAHFYDSSAAADLCYESKIGKATCRPLSESARKPLPVLRVSER